MELDNASRFAANVQVADLRRPERRAVVIVKSTFDLDREGRLKPSDEPMSFVLDQLECPFGEFHGELFPKKRGVDICVLGTVRRPEPVQYARMRLSVGDRHHELLVSGDRAWVPAASRKGLEPSAPVPFTEIPLGYHRAYGGTAEYDGEDAPYSDNPVGVGYYLSEVQAERQKLPNIEPLAGPFVRHWNDPGQVVGWGPYPMYWGLRANRNVELDEQKGWVKWVHPGLFNHAHPELVLDALAPGTPIRIEGLHPRIVGLWAPAPPARVEVTVGANTRAVEAPVDGIFVWADAAKVVVTQRARFGYEFVEEQIRKVTVQEA